MLRRGKEAERAPPGPPASPRPFGRRPGAGEGTRRGRRWEGRLGPAGSRVGDTRTAGQSGREAPRGGGAAPFQLPEEATLRSGFPAVPGFLGCEGSARWLRPPRPSRPGRGQPRRLIAARPQVDSMSSSGPAAEGEGTPDQPASEKEPEIPGPREESEEEDEDDDEEEDEEEEKGGEKAVSLREALRTSLRALFALRGTKWE